jgi:hypothetical protein
MLMVWILHVEVIVIAAAGDTGPVKRSYRQLGSNTSLKDWHFRDSASEGLAIQNLQGFSAFPGF